VVAKDQDRLAERQEAALASDLDGHSGVFRAFEIDEFREWPAWHRLLRILRSNGGSYGLSGARGSGKSWLMLRAIAWVRSAEDTGPLGGIGLWYPTPSEYNALAFLASLTDGFGTEIDRWFRRNRRVLLIRTGERVLSLTLGGLVAVLIAFKLGAPNPPDALAWLIGIAIGALCGLVTRAVLRVAPWAFRKEARLAREAKLVRERARYSATRRESSEFGAEGGRGLIGRFRLARERELIERPATLSSLVNDFRALAEEAGAVAGRVVIAIDELDKMAEPDKVRALLRDIKGIFEVPHVHFLVSVSDEAARSLSLGALAGRNEFNSSFYTVIEVQPAAPEDLAEVLERRSEGRVPREVALTLAVLSGGNPREVLRLSELVGEAGTGADAAAKALEDEALRLRREVITAPETEGWPSVNPDSRVSTFTALPDRAFESSEQLSALARTALDMWETGWGSDAGFDLRFGEAWRRLMLRLTVASQLIDAESLVRDPELGTRLRDVIVAASQSAAIARLVLESELRVEAPRQAVQLDKARAELEELSRRYEQVRGAQPTSRERTRSLDDIAAEIRGIARDVDLSREELEEMLGSKRSGDRVAALAVIQATGDPALFDAVLEAVVDPATDFEGYHALRALETLLPSLDPDQTSRAKQSIDGIRGALRSDSARAPLAERILETLSPESTVS
jgi:KAP-like P-loop domain-containing protein